MPARVDLEALERLHREHPELSQRELAERAGVSQATVSRALGRDDDSDPGQEPEDKDPEPALTRDPIRDLGRRIARLEASAEAAEERGQFGASVTAQRAAAKLSEQLDRLVEEERARTPAERLPDPDEVLSDALVALVEDVPEPVFERVEDAVDRRRRRAAEGARDGG